MKRSFLLVLTMLATVAVATGLAALPPASAAAPTQAGVPLAATGGSWTPPAEPHLAPVAATSCPLEPTAGQATCLAEARPATDTTAVAAGAEHAENAADIARASADSATPLASLTSLLSSLAPRNKSDSYTPDDLASLYRIPPDLSPNATVGIVDVGSDPNTEAQLSYYRSFFSLPACTAANGCFREVDQDGGSSLPPTVSAWVVETALDVQAVSAICPSCHILLVDSRSAAVSDLARAALTATQLGATYVSLSFGSAESSGTTALQSSYYANPNVTYVAAAGDSGYDGQALFPASAPNVVAAGGTSVKLVDGLWQQTAWKGSGSGCSAQSLISTVQTLLSLGGVCGGRRAVSDLSALADPATGMLFYRAGSWWNGGGTSLAAPILTGLYALAGNHTAPLAVYRAASSLVDVTSGSTGVCATAQLCNAVAGWDGPTGLGTPAGVSALAGVDGPSRGTHGTLTTEPGYPVRLTYRLTDDATGAGVPAADVLLERRRADGSFEAIDAGPTNVGGLAVFTDHPKTATTYRVAFGGDVMRDPSTSNTTSIATFRAKVKLSRAAGRLRATAQAPWGGALARFAATVQRRHGTKWKNVRRVRTNKHGVAVAKVKRGSVYRLRYGGGSWQIGQTAGIRLR